MYCFSYTENKEGNCDWYLFGMWSQALPILNIRSGAKLTTFYQTAENVSGHISDLHEFVRQFNSWLAKLEAIG